ncbi:peptidoglycan-binding protein [Clostridium sp. SHJSY1]|uniref:peptidoglycan-binding domain-containing protein n=1 Tax=Clostridium sp. SHJSY1 TaxID=2942483 RepID=UPI0028751C5A|nr:peptidoglycan-binding domain-containing protein [Clostridium sp. SHJSY1]MDS0526918.1 peptidoglycan-binding protein [Clostridium sp. SHJSY1]
MAIVYIYNEIYNRIEKYYRNEYDPVPYSIGTTLTVGEFRGSSKSSVLWTNRKTVDSWNVFRRSWGRPIYVGYAFKRIWEGGHSDQSQHYAGTAFDMGQTLNSTDRDRLRNFASAAGVWSYVEPKSLTPTWVHVDDRFGLPACSAGGFPSIVIGNKGNYVFIVQDALNALGYKVALDGVYGVNTENAIRAFQKAKGINVNGIVNCGTWTRLTDAANGIGRTSTVVSP